MEEGKRVEGGTFDLHAIDGADGGELLLKVFEVPAGARLLQEADGVADFFWVAVCFALVGGVSERDDGEVVWRVAYHDDRDCWVAMVYLYSLRERRWKSL